MRSQLTLKHPKVVKPTKSHNRVDHTSVISLRLPILAEMQEQGTGKRAGPPPQAASYSICCTRNPLGDTQ
jgi:hypothetical protein